MSRQLLVQAIHQLAPAHLRHHHVGDQQVDAARKFPDQRERLFAVGGFQHFEAMLGEEFSNQRSDAAFVFDHEHGFALGRFRRGNRLHRRRRNFRWARNAFEIDAIQPCVGGAIRQRDIAAPVPDHSVGLREASRGIIGRIFLWQEALESGVRIAVARAVRTNDGDCGIFASPQRNLRALQVFVDFETRNFDPDAALRRCLSRRIEHCDQDLFELRHARPHATATQRACPFDAQPLAHRAHHRIEFDNFSRGGLLARERQQIRRQAADALGGAEDLLHFGAQRTRGGQTVQQLFAVAGQDHEHVVQVMRHAGGQPAHRFHALGLHHLLFQEPPLGHIH